MISTIVFVHFRKLVLIWSLFLYHFLLSLKTLKNDNIEKLSTMVQLTCILAAVVLLVLGKYNTFSYLTKYDESN